jgi:hypothetical protein
MRPRPFVTLLKAWLHGAFSWPPLLVGLPISLWLRSFWPYAVVAAAQAIINTVVVWPHFLAELHIKWG